MFVCRHSSFLILSALLLSSAAVCNAQQQTAVDGKNKDQHPHFESWLLGMIGWISMVNPTQGEKLRADFAELQNGFRE